MKPGRVSPKLDYRNFRSVPVNKARSSVINGNEMVTRHSKEYSEGWERIFGGRKTEGALEAVGTAKIPEGRATRYVLACNAGCWRSAAPGKCPGLAECSNRADEDKP